MMIGFLLAGIALLIGGLLTVAYGIQLELSFGNTLILTGAVVACTGVIVLGLWAVLRELRGVSRRLGAAERNSTPAGRRKEPAIEDLATAPTGIYGRSDNRGAASWQEEAGARDRIRSHHSSPPEAVAPAPAQKARRHLLFSSSLRKQRESETLAPEANETDALQDAGRKPAGGGNSVPTRRSGRSSSSVAETNAGASLDETLSVAADEQPTPVTVLKSGIVDGMAYSLYSDGSIEAQMPEGMMRFASIEDLRAHLDQRA